VSRASQLACPSIRSISLRESRVMGHGLVPHRGSACTEAALNLCPGGMMAHEDFGGTGVSPASSWRRASPTVSRHEARRQP
jgi:hypothetical protein